MDDGDNRSPSDHALTLAAEPNGGLAGETLVVSTSESQAPPMWRLTEAQKQEAVRRYEAGESCAQVAAAFAVTRQSMWDVLRRRTTMRPKPAGPENHFWRGGSRAVDAAQNKTEKAILRGELIRPATCEKCGDEKRFADGRSAIQAHHPDYAKPLEVMWLCQRCHHEWHKTNVARGVMPSEATQGESTSSAEASRSRAKTSPSPDADAGSLVSAPASSLSSPESPTLFDPAGYSSRTFLVSSLATAVGTLESCLERWPSSGTAWLGGFSTADTSECPSADGECSWSATTLADVLEPSPPARLSLSARAAAGILRRAQKRGRELPRPLLAALRALASTRPADGSRTT